MSEHYQFGLTKHFPCSYLPDQQEQLLVAVDEKLHETAQYEWLMNNGFRRSGEQLYRPHCAPCHACHSIRVPVADFKPSTNQRKLLRKNSQLKIIYNRQPNLIDYFPLYEQYINTLHRDGSMYPADYIQFKQFIPCKFCPQIYLEMWQDNQLVSVAVTDELQHSLSAIYTFYHPAMRQQSLGMFSILQQIALALLLHKDYVYLGYQIDACQKMNYKTKFYPHHRLIENQWFLINK